MAESLEVSVAKIASTLEYNTKMTEGMAQKVSGMGSDISDIKEHLARLNGRINAHDTYLENLNQRTVENRTDIVKNNEKIHEELNSVDNRISGKIAEKEGESKVTGAIWGGIIGLVSGGAITLLDYFLKK